MSTSKRKRKQRRRSVSRNIARKTDREIMETIFPKRVMNEVDQVLADHESRSENAPMKGS